VNGYLRGGSKQTLVIAPQSPRRRT